MKPSFALSLSFEGIGLLHRSFPGWNRVGEVGLDTPDLAGALAVLRETAQQINGQVLTSKLVIPNDQIKYLTLDIGPVGEDERDRAIRAALDGATPYPVNDLVYDWSVDGEQTHVAAVARETLSEAEAFAVDHGFGPVSFVGLPAEGQFAGEPFFGPTRFADTLLGEGETVQRDMAPIRVTGVARLPEPDDEDEVEAEDENEAAADAPETEPAAEAVVEDGQPATPVNAETAEVSAETVGQSDSEVVTAAEPEPEPETEPESEPEEVLTDGPTEPETETAREPQAEDTVPAFSTIRARRDEAAPPAPALSGVRRGAEDLIAPSIPIPSGDEFASAEMAPEIEGIPEAYEAYDDRYEEMPDDVPPMPVDPVGEASSEGRMAFFSRRGSALASGIGASIAAGGARLAEARAERRAAQPIQAAQTVQSTRINAETERQRMTVFGARKPEKARAAVGGKPRYLGLILTAVLLLFLAGVAAWASIFVDEGLARFFGPRERVITSLEPSAVDELMAEGEEAMVPDPAGAVIETAALETGVSDAILAEPLRQPAQPQALTPEEAQARYAVTGVWQRAPDAPELPEIGVLDDLYVASIDPGVGAQDAVALPDARTALSDLVPSRIGAAAERGARFALDARGLVVASAAGTVNPDGILVFAGRPAKVPGAVPGRETVQPQAEAEAERVETARLAGLRPKSRPGGIVEGNERSTNNGLTKRELAAKRPKLRPEQAIAKIEEEADETATEFAVAASKKPVARPGNFSRVVKRAETTEPEVTQVAAVPAPKVTPSIPSKSNVAKAATVRNAINLSKVNLIGVYGKPSSRRALVRLSNGRYKKVQVGDRIDGGRISAIGDSELRYEKNGRNVILKMPKG